MPIIAGALAEATVREHWLQRLWDAYQEDAIPYIESLGDYWGDLCASADVASRWADKLIGTCRMAWSPDPNLCGFFKGTSNCLSALFAAKRYNDILELLQLAPYNMWHYRQYGVRALAAMGRKTEAIRLAEDRALNDSSEAIAKACEEILLSSGLTEEAYRGHGLVANRAGRYTAWFRAVAKRYPHKQPADILADLVAFTAGEEGKWFAAAKDAGMFEEAIALANRSPCAPQTLTRAARDFADTNPRFATQAGMAALHWLVAGYGYDITGLDVLSAYEFTLKAAENSGRAAEVRQWLRDLLSSTRAPDAFVTELLARTLSAKQP